MNIPRIHPGQDYLTKTAGKKILSESLSCHEQRHRSAADVDGF